MIISGWFLSVFRLAADAPRPSALRRLVSEGRAGIAWALDARVRHSLRVTWPVDGAQVIIRRFP
jgi:hypothetical protein